MCTPRCDHPLTMEDVKSCLLYDPETGVFRYTGPRPGVKCGTIAGSATSRGYISIGIRRRTYLAHRVAWFYVYGEWPQQDLDHINGNRADNRISNLRQVSHSENMQNQKHASKNNKCGLLGVSLERRINKYTARIRVDGRNVNLGYFPTADEAHRAYLAMKTQHHEAYVS